MLKFVYAYVICVSVILLTAGCASTNTAAPAARPVVKYEDAVIEKIWAERGQISFIIDRHMNEKAEIAIIPMNAESRGSLFFKGVIGNDLSQASPESFKPGDIVHFMQRNGFLQEMMDTDGKNLYTKTTILGWEEMMAGSGMGGGMAAQMQLCPKGMLLYSGTVVEISEKSVKVNLISRQDRLIAAFKEPAKAAGLAKGEHVKIRYSAAADGSVILDEIVR